MRREFKYPDTESFRFYNVNPKNRYTEDCVVRAISTATEIPYNDVAMGLAKMACETGYSTVGNKGIDAYLKSIGWVKHSQPKRTNNTRYTGKEFCLELANKNERYIVSIGSHHKSSIVNGKIHDIWDCSHGSIGVYWTKN